MIDYDSFYSKQFWYFFLVGRFFCVITGILLFVIVFDFERLRSKRYVRILAGSFVSWLVFSGIVSYAIVLAKPYLVEKEVFLFKTIDKNSEYKEYVLDAFTYAGFTEEKIPVKEKKLDNVVERYEIKYEPNTRDHKLSKSDVSVLNPIGKRLRHFVVKKYTVER